MILLDSSVIIDFWKSRRDPSRHAAIADVLGRPGLHICGVTLAELMAGALDALDCDRIEREVGRFVRLHVEDADWTALGRNLYRLRTGGIHVPFPDALLATIALSHDLEVWTLDSRFADIRRVLTDLRLFQGP